MVYQSCEFTCSAQLLDFVKGPVLTLLQWLGTWVFDRVLPKMFGLDKLKALVRGKAKKA